MQVLLDGGPFESDDTVKKRLCKRDNNVKVLYELENAELPCGAKFKDLDEVRDYVGFVTGSALWRNSDGLPQHVRVFSLGDLDYSESHKPNEIWLARRHWDQQVVLHELAHFFHKDFGHPGNFVAAYLTLVEWFMGKEFARRYRAAFIREGIKCG